jgi:EAL domain-containing protein (putative c-di-GMP-specific phosphodiesterase class I)/PAS domain-containing protein
MNQPTRVLLVQRRHDQGRLRQSLQHESALDFEWRRVFSENELRIAAGEYAPSVVLCADDMLADSARATLNVLAMLGKQPPQLLICEVCQDSAPWSSAAAELTAPWLQPAFLDTGGKLATGRSAALPGDCAVMPAARPQLPALLRSSFDAVLMLDGNGWITDLNAHAQRLLGMGAHKRAKAQAHLQDVIFALQAAGEDRCTSLPLVALNLDGLMLLNAHSQERFGDAALELIAGILQSQYARCGLLARVGADQYLALLPHMSQPADAAVSVGAARHTHAESDLSSLFGSAAINDTSIMSGPPNLAEGSHQGKQGGAKRAPSSAHQIAADLSEAIERHALCVHFQPQYELTSGQGSGAEALARWTLASGASITPHQFIPIAERSGTIGALDAWMLKTACTAALQWRGRGAESRTLAVNVSDRELRADYSRLLGEILRTCRFPAHRLELEIGEAPITSNSPAVNHCLQQWRQLGVRIAVIHRSGNYSALEYLGRTAVDRLKLDKSLIHGMTHHPGTASTVQAIIALCAELHVDVIAEGVETQAQLAMLRDFNCPKVQGFLLARPMPALQAQVVPGKTWGNLSASAARSRLAIAHEVQSGTLSAHCTNSVRRAGFRRRPLRPLTANLHIYRLC